MMSYFYLMAMAHGVPKPTASGELWCFNRTYPLAVSIQEVQGLVRREFAFGSVRLLENFNMYAERRDHEINILHGGYPVSRGSSTNVEFYPISCLWCKQTSSILSRVTCRHIHFMSYFSNQRCPQIFHHESSTTLLQTWLCNYSAT